MCNAYLGRFFLAGAAMGIVAAAIVAPLPCSAAEPTVDPRLKALVDKHLRRDPNYAPGDILSRGNVEPIFNELLELGLQPATGNEGAYSPFLRDGDYLVQTLRSPRGRVLMRKVSGLPEVYDRLERMSWTAVGRSWIEQLVAAENGAELLAGMLTEEGLQSVELQLAADERGRNFRLPTGRVHTETQLLARLQLALESQAGKSAAK